MRYTNGRTRLTQEQAVARHIKRTSRQGPRGDKDQAIAAGIPTMFRRYARQYAKVGH